MHNTPRKQFGPSTARFLSRSSRLVLVGGLAAGAGFAAVTGISSATGSSSTTTNGSNVTTPAPAPEPGGHGRHGGFGGERSAGGLQGRPGSGGGGTITAITGSTLTLRTENGTETVDTSSSTTYSKERQTVSFTTLAVGDVIHVRATPSSNNGSAGATPPEPGTGIVNAASVTVVEPTFAGRVSASDNGTYTIVGRDGRQFTVATTATTRYYDGSSPASSSAVVVGDRVMAEGSQDSVAHLTADVISVRPARPSEPPSPGGSSGTPSQAPSTAS